MTQTSPLTTAKTKFLRKNNYQNLNNIQLKKKKIKTLKLMIKMKILKLMVKIRIQCSTDMGITRSLLPHNQGKFTLPLFGGNFVSFYQTKLPLKTVKSLPFSLIIVNFLIFSLNYHILYFQMYFQYFSFLQKYPINISKTGNILQSLEWKFSQKRLFLILRIFLIIYRAHFVRSSVRNVFFRTYYFRTVYFKITYLLCMF